ncbi:MAG: AAA family ATPase [Candidatus Hydrogenedentes bacterium]|nr:AAA family ATPase [Candidatus Hydrogenedentota bacterium]
MEPSADLLQEVALALRLEWVRKGFERGWRFVRVDGKRPIKKGWRTPPTERNLEAYLEYAAQGSIGLPTGADTGIIVVDCDEGADIGALDLPETVTAITGGGGRHFYFRVPEKVRIGNSTGRIAPHVDVRGEGGVVVYVGSVHPDTGKVYHWAEGLSPDEVDFAPFPEHLLPLLGGDGRPENGNADELKSEPGEEESPPRIIKVADPLAYGEKALKNACEKIASAPNGSRNSVTNTEAYGLGQITKSCGLDFEAVYTSLVEAACEAGLPADEVHATVSSGMAAGAANPRVFSSQIPVPYKEEDDGQESQPATPPDSASSQEDSRPPVLLTKGGQEMGRESGPKMRPLKLGDFYAQASKPTEWLVDDLLIMGGLSALVAKPKVGKTTLALHLAVCVATGSEFLGREVRQGSVLLLSFEESPNKLAERLNALGATDDTPIHVYCGPAPQDGIDELASLIRELKPSLVVVDTLIRFAKIKDINDYSIVTRALEPTLTLARASGSHIQLIHHAGKGENRGAESVLGSTAIHGTVDTTILMERRADGRYVSTEQRYGNDMEPTRLTFDGNTGAFSIDTNASEGDSNPLERGILAYLKDQSQPVPEDFVKKAVKGKTELFRETLRTLVDNGTVLRCGTGRRGDPYLYVLNSNPTVTDPADWQQQVGRPDMEY